MISFHASIDQTNVPEGQDEINLDLLGRTGGGRMTLSPSFCSTN